MNKYLVAVLFLFLFTLPLWAHEGEVHEEAKATVPLASQGGMIIQETATETMELVLKYPPLEPKEKATLRLFLNTADENRPISGAKIDFEVSALKDFKVSFIPIPSQPGIYSAEVVFPTAGSFDAVISISGKEASDLLTLSGIRVGSPETSHSSSNLNRKLWMGIVLFLLILVATLIVLYQRRQHVP